MASHTRSSSPSRDSGEDVDFHSKLCNILFFIFFGGDELVENLNRLVASPQMQQNTCACTLPNGELTIQVPARKT